MFTTRIFYDENRVSSLDGESVSPEIPINNEPQDEDPIVMASHQEGPQDGHEQTPLHPEHEHEPQPHPEPQSEPQPRRSGRIKAKNKLQDAVPPKVKTSAKSTSRKRAARKK